MEVAKRERWRLMSELDRWLRWPMIVLSAAWLVIVVIELVKGESSLLETLGSAIWIIFIVEYVLRLWIAPDKKLFFKHNWLTLIALIVPALRLLRIFAVLRAASALRAVRLVGYVVATTILVTLLGAAGMWSFENARDVPGGFTSYADAAWWTAMLLTTIGSQYWPVTAEGRFLALLLSIYGLGVLGYITATLASFFVGRDAQSSRGPVAGSDEIKALRKEIAGLRADLAERGPRR